MACRAPRRPAGATSSTAGRMPDPVARSRVGRRPVGVGTTNKAARRCRDPARSRGGAAAGHRYHSGCAGECTPRWRCAAGGRRRPPAHSCCRCAAYTRRSGELRGRQIVEDKRRLDGGRDRRAEACGDRCRRAHHSAAGRRRADRPPRAADSADRRCVARSPEPAPERPKAAWAGSPAVRRPAPNIVSAWINLQVCCRTLTAQLAHPHANADHPLNHNCRKVLPKCGRDGAASGWDRTSRPARP